MCARVEAILCPPLCSDPLHLPPPRPRPWRLQVTFLSAAMACGAARRVLIVAPVPVLAVWTRELAKFAHKAMADRVRVFHGTSSRERAEALALLRRHAGVCVTSYGMCVSSVERLAEVAWDYVVCDEGHKLKNPSIQVPACVCAPLSACASSFVRVRTCLYALARG